ncbi:ATP synthase F1, gamma subunit [Denitrovibrio acetiphilus DSM 12809]|uniref:ATP synthase gamma chain n=1 Tax=Denitrovibrio acetiphilus (strain DSM 12809 / NBRC 114555 / N2460) TaxID=522772 RepID=D4H616_DENA2|nr:ATP synthase F1 subunit gamma [Denitrovibrio acetiphilus]ADD67662.1 ATP synthase F1, gamma subunit [Denitrovibrio acetiphilus DSM 12809]
MPGIMDIKRKIKSVQNTQKITKAMKMVSAARMRKAEEAMNDARAYANKIYELCCNMAEKVDSESHPFLAQKAEVKNICLAIITSDKGLCGAFNSNVLKKTTAFIKEHEGKNIKFVMVGKKGNDAFGKRGYEVLEKYITFGGRITYEEAGEIGDKLVDYYLNEEVDEIYTIHNEFKSTSVQVGKVTKVLPLAFEAPEVAAADGAVDYIYEPKADVLLKEIMPRYINFTVFFAVLESIAGEHGARMIAMDNASRNAGDLVRKLELQFNKARQAAITTEILDIVNGAEALNG